MGFLVTAILVLLICILWFLIKNHNGVKQIKNNEPHSAVSKPASNKTGQKRKSTQKRRTQKMKWRDKMLDISMIPDTVELHKEYLLPQSLKRQYGYGKRFNCFIVSDDSLYYHKSTCKKINGKNKKVVHRYIASQKLEACPHCSPNAFVDDWYLEFLKKNFEKFTSYEDFQAWNELPAVSLPETRDTRKLESAKQLSFFDETEN